MMLSVMNLRAQTIGFAILCALGAQGQKRPPQIVKPLAGPRAAALQVTWLYVSPDKSAQKVARVQTGRELVIAEKSGGWLRVYANTDVEEEHSEDEPVFGSNDTPPPITGWMEAKGIVSENLPNGDQILLGAAATEEVLAADPRGPANAAQAARLLYRRVVEMFPNSPLAAEAAWRAADIRWQLQKADYHSLPSAKLQNPALRNQMDEDELRKVMKYYPHTRWADLADFDLIDNKLCGDWQGQEKCPDRESDIYERYAAEHPNGPRTAQALYEACYRQAVLTDMYRVDGNNKRQDDSHRHAGALAAQLKDKFPESDYTWRAAALVFKLDQGVPVYGIDQP